MMIFIASSIAVLEDHYFLGISMGKTRNNQTNTTTGKLEVLLWKLLSNRISLLGMIYESNDLSQGKMK